MYCKKLYNFCIKKDNPNKILEDKLKELDTKNILLSEQLLKIENTLNNVLKRLKFDLELEEYIDVNRDIDMI